MSDYLEHSLEWMEMRLSAGLMTECIEDDIKVRTVIDGLDRANARADRCSALAVAATTRGMQVERERDALAERVRVLEGEQRRQNVALYGVGVQLNNHRIPRQSRILNALEVLDALEAPSPSPLVEGGR
jgi:hypothetical protein